MSFVLGPSDSPVNDSKSDTIDGNFGGNRQVTSNIQKGQNYKKPSGAAPNRVQNPKDAVKDIDAIREFDGSKVQDSTEDDFIIKADSDNRPPEDTDAFIPDGDPVKMRRSKNKYHFGGSPY